LSSILSVINFYLLIETLIQEMC